MATDIIRKGQARVKRQVEFEPVSEIQTRRIEWLWKGVLARGKVTLLTGLPGLGKSLLSLDIAAKITRGASLPDGSNCPIGRVLLLCGEDDFADTVKPRLEAANADTSHIVRPKVHVDLASNAESLLAVGEVALIVVDPVTTFLDGVNIDKSYEVRPVMESLAGIASQLNAAMLLITHPSKVTGRAAVHSAVGSQAFTAVARLAWQVSTDGDETLLLPVKANICKGASGQRFRIVGHNEQPCIEWLGCVDMKADDIALPPAARLKRLAEQAVRDCVGTGLAKQVLIEQATSLIVQQGIAAPASEISKAVGNAINTETVKGKHGFQGAWLRLPKQ